MVAQIELPVAQGMELRKPSTMDLLQVALQNNAAIDVIERLAALQLDQRKLDAEVGFDEELNICQREVQTVVVDSEKTGPGGKKWATYKALDKAIRPIYTARGLSFVRFGPRATRMRCGSFLLRAAGPRDRSSARRYRPDGPPDPAQSVEEFAPETSCIVSVKRN
jgi:hypothetical protein